MVNMLAYNVHPNLWKTLRFIVKAIRTADIVPWHMFYWGVPVTLGILFYSNSSLAGPH